MPFRWVHEDLPAEHWQGLFVRTWPSYRAWFLKEGDLRRPSLQACQRKLEHHMPELLGLWRHLVHLAGGDPQVARMLSLYRPTPYLAACSQAVWLGVKPMLVRNYDYHPSACEGQFVLSAWGGTRVLMSSDCLWGALDGMNEHGLAVALAFGGSQDVGDGFGIPLILRYTLQVCRNTAEAISVLSRVPTHMAYNVSVLDAAGAHAVVQLSPVRAPVVTRAHVTTNHQAVAEWPAYVARTRSREREHALDATLQDPKTNSASLLSAFLRPPVFADQYGQAFGTLYTAAYSTKDRHVTYLWPRARVEQRLDDFREQDLVVPLGAAVPRAGV